MGNMFLNMTKLRPLLLAVLLMFSASALALKTKQEQIIALETVLAELRVHYGKLKYKNKVHGITLEGLREKYTRLIQEARTLEEDLGFDPPQEREILPPNELRQLLIGMIAELHDGHVNINRQGKELATVGLLGASIGEHLYVTAVRKDLMIPDSSMQEIKVGDEILEINGRSVVEEAKRNLIYESAGTFENAWTDAMQTILLRSESATRLPKEGEAVTLKLRREDKEFIAKLRWVYNSEYRMLTERFPKEVKSTLEKIYTEDRPTPYGIPGTVRSYFRTGLVTNPELYHAISDTGAQLNQEIEKAKEQAKDEKTPKTVPPNLKDLSPVERLQLYSIRYKGKTIGVLRVPSYSPPNGMGEAVNEIKWIAEGLKRMNKQVDGLIIDHLSNAGGMVYYTKKLMSLFARGAQPMQTFSIDYKLNETLLNGFKPGVYKDPMTGEQPSYAEYRLSEAHYKALRQRYDAGEEWSGLISYDAFDFAEESGLEFAPKEGGVFEGPVVVMNDRRSASGGDFFPIQLQYNGRAKIMGETSCGLGGPVNRKIDSMPGSEMSFRCTIAYVELPNGWPIEEVGGVPDIYLPVAEKDLKNGFKDYSLKALDNMVDVIDAESGKTEKAKPEDAKKEAQPKEVLKGKRKKIVTLSKSLSPASYSLGTVNKLTQLAQDKSVDKKEWQDVLVPLPETLTKGDFLLRTLWQRLEVVARLKEMKKLPLWSTPEHEEDRQLIEALIILGEAAPETLTFANPCELRLSMGSLK